MTTKSLYKLSSKIIGAGLRSGSKKNLKFYRIQPKQLMEFATAVNQLTKGK